MQKYRIAAGTGYDEGMAYLCPLSGSGEISANDTEVYLASEVDARIAELEKALRFYEQEIRYQGPNQREVNGDIYTPAGAVYLQDVTRDRGAIARAALKLGL